MLDLVQNPKDRVSHDTAQSGSEDESLLVVFVRFLEKSKLLISKAFHNMKPEAKENF